MFTDVVSWEVLFAPEQGAEITSTVLANVEKAITNHGTIYSSQYSCDDSSIINAFLATESKTLNLYSYSTRANTSADMNAHSSTLLSSPYRQLNGQ